MSPASRWTRSPSPPLGRFVLDRMRVDPLAELSVLLVDPDAMAALHQQWMDLPGPTDVMAFPMDFGDLPPDRDDLTAPPGSAHRHADALLGDVVLCPAVAADQAASAGHSVEAELHLLCTHGILHLLGYDHGDDGGGAGDVRPAGQVAPRVGEGHRPQPDPHTGARNRRRGP